MAALLVSAAMFTACGGDDGGGGDTPPPADTRPIPPASNGTDEVKGTQGILDDSVVQFRTDGTYQITFADQKTETGTYTYYSGNSVVVLKSNTAGDALVALSYTVGSGNVLTLTPALFISDVSSLSAAELLSTEPASYSGKSEVFYQNSGSPTSSSSRTKVFLYAVKEGVPADASGAYWVITTSSSGSYKKAQVTFRLGGAYAQWKNFTGLPVTPPSFNITGYPAGEEATAILFSGTAAGLIDIYQNSTATGDVYSGGGIVWYNIPPAGTYTLYVRSDSTLKKATVTIADGGTGTIAWSAFTAQTESGAFTITGYNGTAGVQVIASSNLSSSMPDGIGTIAANGAVTWWFAPPTGTYYVIVGSGSSEKYATGVAIAAGNGSKAWSDFRAMGYAFTITNYPYSSGTVYACSSNPTSTSQVTSYMIGSGSVNSTGEVVWGSAISSSYSSYYIVVYYNSTYYKYATSVSSSTTSISWSNFSAISSSSSSLGITNYPYSSGSVYACSSNPTSTSQVSSYMIGSGSINSSGTVTWSSAPSSSSYYIVVYYSSTYYKYATSVSSSTTSLSWSNFSAISSSSSSLGITNYPYSSGTVYACSSNPTSTSQVSSYMIGSGSINSSGTVTWSSAPSSSSYYIVVYYSSAYYKYPISVSSSTTSLSWSSFSSMTASTPENVTSLSSGIWTNGSITSAGGVKWYSFAVTSGTSYYLWWNDAYQGDSTKTLDVKVSFTQSDGTTISGYVDLDSAWTTPQSFSVSSSGTLYIKVQGYSSTNTGTFGICYSTTTTRPSL
jgi:hypothetical protein